MTKTLAAQPREESCEAVVIGLAPLLIRMVMALRALHAHAEKRRGGRFGPLFLITVDEEVDRAVLMISSDFMNRWVCK